MNKLLDKTRAMFAVAALSAMGSGCKAQRGFASVVTTVAVAVMAVLASVFSPAAMAAAIDVDDVVADIGAQLVPVAAIAGAVLLVFVALKAWKWIRKALS